MTPTGDTRGDHAVADHIRAVERARLRALVAGDIAGAAELHAPDFQLITPVGAALSRDDYLGAIATGRMNYLEWDPGPIHVRVHGAAAVVRYQAALDVVVEGHQVPRSTYWHTDTYENIDGRWQVVWSQATAVKTYPGRG
ncbi:nuclear transport factor 2 family protein [Solihabitans fulvus]|uniref:Nuclear transport factor 2 family protein n=1 Tax=Solihabitans fulvus TaxID=1892852 RepID=A0A5B2XP38_9PSEU|nr:nuclear transport factor 2 family protein [Solihabitans fulvus]KAA2265678.1 nuclear transport factor 2 family protein [Solihabitans fulvus]